MAASSQLQLLLVLLLVLDFDLALPKCSDHEGAAQKVTSSTSRSSNPAGFAEYALAWNPMTTMLVSMTCLATRDYVDPDTEGTST